VRRSFRRMGWAFIGSGAFVLCFLVYHLVGTNSAASTAQADLRQSLERQWGSQAGGAPAAFDPAGSTPSRWVPLGQAFALIQIPRIGVERVVVEGVGRDELRKGPGHVPSTVPPGQPGTFAVSGHRTTYGAPFYRLDELRSGDQVRIVTRTAVFTYAVSRTQVVRPSDVWVLGNVRGPNGRPKPTITLTTCNPRFSARQRLIVFGNLVSSVPNRSAPAA
jgi:sortase A